MGLVKGAPARGFLAKIDDAGNQGDTLDFQFNPSSIKRSVGVGWTLQIPPGGYLPIPMFGAANVETISFELFLDAREFNGSGKFSLRQFAYLQMSFIESLVRADVASDDADDFAREEFVAPPLCLFGFGLNRPPWFVVAQRADITEELFDVDLTPVRIRVALELAVVINVKKQQSNLQEILQAAASARNVIHRDEGTRELIVGAVGGDIALSELAQ